MVVGRFTSSEKNLKAKLLASFWSDFLPFVLAAIKRPMYAGSATFAIKEEIFRKVKGYNERLNSFEDAELTNKIAKKGEIVFDKKCVSFASMRRFEKDGYLKWLIIGSFISMYYFIKRKSFDKLYYPIR